MIRRIDPNEAVTLNGVPVTGRQLAAARQELSHRGVHNPRWAELSQHDQDTAAISAGSWLRALAELLAAATPPVDPRRKARAADPHAHACISCSPDGVLPGLGCGTCRQTGMDQTPCIAPGHVPQCPHGCCGGPRKPATAPDQTEAGEGR